MYKKCDHSILRPESFTFLIRTFSLYDAYDGFKSNIIRIPVLYQVFLTNETHLLWKFHKISKFLSYI